jgi:Cys-tRNA(Pro)/Cys-tRNA(Cys) deacylase
MWSTKGYRVGAFSPFGQKHKIATIIEAEVLSASQLYVSGGRQGVELRLNPEAVQRATGAAVAMVGFRREGARRPSVNESAVAEGRN